MTAGFVDTSSPLRHSAPSVFLIQVACCKMSDFDEFEKQLSENRQGECAVLALLLAPLYSSNGLAVVGGNGPPPESVVDFMNNQSELTTA